MFYVSKIVWLLAQPLALAFFLSVFAGLLGLLGWRRSGAAMALAASSTLFLTLYTTTGNLALQALEDQVPHPASEPRQISCMIVLGGAIENDVMNSRGGMEFNAAADRYTEALRLAIAHPEARILVSGGDGSFSGRYEGEAAAAERFFAGYGVSAERVIKENESRNTWENVQRTKTLLEKNGLRDCLLITSAFHMPRATTLFEKAGLTVKPWPVDYRTSGIVSPGLDFTQPSLNAQNTSTAVREWLGLIGYRIAGRID